MAFKKWGSIKEENHIPDYGEKINQLDVTLSQLKVSYESQKIELDDLRRSLQIHEENYHLTSCLIKEMNTMLYSLMEKEEMSNQKLKGLEKLVEKKIDEIHHSVLNVKHPITEEVGETGNKKESLRGRPKKKRRIPFGNRHKFPNQIIETGNGAKKDYQSPGGRILERNKNRKLKQQAKDGFISDIEILRGKSMKGNIHVHGAIFESGRGRK